MRAVLTILKSFFKVGYEETIRILDNFIIGCKDLIIIKNMYLQKKAVIKNKSQLGFNILNTV